MCEKRPKPDDNTTILAALIRGQMILLYLKHESDEAREPMGRKHNTS